MIRVEFYLHPSLPYLPKINPNAILPLPSQIEDIRFVKYVVLCSFGCLGISLEL
jgi:hypothetical protein